MQKEIKVNENGTVEVHVSVSPSTGRVTEVRSHNVSEILRAEGVKHGHPMPNNPVVSSDLHTAGVSLSGVFRFEAPEVVPAALAAALGVDPSTPSVEVVAAAAPVKKKPAASRSRKKTTAKATAKKSTATSEE